MPCYYYYYIFIICKLSFSFFFINDVESDFSRFFRQHKIHLAMKIIELHKRYRSKMDCFLHQSF